MERCIDLIYKGSLVKPYYVLQLTTDGAHLYRSGLNHLEEVKDANFPLTFHEEFESHTPSRSDVYNSYLYTNRFINVENSRTEIEQARYEAFAVQVDEALNNYLYSDTRLFLGGSGRNISCFKQLSAHTDNIAGTISPQRQE